MSKNYLSRHNELRMGDSLVSNNGKFKAIFQVDANFVIYEGGRALWASNTDGSDGFRLCMQSDCNLVMYNNKDAPTWSTDSYTLEANMCRMQLTDEGNLELYREAENIWSSVSSIGKKV